MSTTQHVSLASSVCFTCGYEAGAFDPCPECGSSRSRFDLPRDVDPSLFRRSWQRYGIENTMVLILYGLLPLVFDVTGAMFMGYKTGGLLWMICGMLMIAIVILRVGLVPHRMLLGPYRRLVIDLLTVGGAIGAVAVGNELRVTGGGGGQGTQAMLMIGSLLCITALPFVFANACSHAVARFRGYRAIPRLRRLQLAVLLSAALAFPLLIPGVAPAFNSFLQVSGLPATGVGIIALVMLLAFSTITLLSANATARALDDLRLRAVDG